MNFDKILIFGVLVIILSSITMYQYPLLVLTGVIVPLVLTVFLFRLIKKRKKSFNLKWKAFIPILLLLSVSHSLQVDTWSYPSVWGAGQVVISPHLEANETYAYCSASFQNATFSQNFNQSSEWTLQFPMSDGVNTVSWDCQSNYDFKSGNIPIMAYPWFVLIPPLLMIGLSSFALLYRKYPFALLLLSLAIGASVFTPSEPLLPLMILAHSFTMFCVFYVLMEEFVN